MVAAHNTVWPHTVHADGPAGKGLDGAVFLIPLGQLFPIGISAVDIENIGIIWDFPQQFQQLF